MFKSFGFFCLLFSLPALAADRFVNVRIADYLQTQINFDSLNLGSTPSLTQPAFAATLISAPDTTLGSFEKNSERCGGQKSEMLVEAVRRAEEVLHAAIRQALDGAFSNMGLKITQIEIHLPFRLHNVGYDSHYLDVMNTYEFSLGTYDWVSGKHGEFIAKVTSSDGQTREFGIYLHSLNLHLSHGPHVEKVFNELGDLVSERTFCKFAVKFWRDESRYGFGSIYSKGTSRKVANIHLPYVLVNDGFELR